MPVNVQQLEVADVVQKLQTLQQPFHGNYLAMYSSWYGGVVTHPALMLVPIDDHLVHRGDGVFEAFKCVGGKVYALKRHLDRLVRSAAAIALVPPLERPALEQSIVGTIRIAGVNDCLIRVFVSRGPGGFTTNPYECPASQLYIVVTHLTAASEEKYQRGVTLITSRVPIKKAYFANIKSCNYLPNVLMKKEAEDAGVNYTLSIDEQGFIGECSTENIGVITKRKEFLVPRFDAVLRGTTVTRTMELAGSLVAEGVLSRIAEAQITVEQASEAAELIVFGTTFDVLPVVQYDGRPIGGGKPGPIFHRFLQLLHDDMRFCDEMLTPVTA
jgi:branched-subunit amino acid aminotransferase/4-amino-4-deoxychorismate lyase